MLNITITEQTPHHMLRAIRAACNELLGETTADLTTQAAQHNSRAEELRIASERELDKSASCLTAHTAERQVAANPALAASYGQGGPVDAGQFYRVGDNPSEQIVWAQGLNEPPMGKPLADAPETDSTGAEWNAELHASTKAKNQDGTWKKRRGAGKAERVEDDPDMQDVHDEIMRSEPSDKPALPPLPPAPPTAPLATMNDIYALISGGKCVLNDVIAGAQAMGFADVGAFSRDATPEQRAQLLQELTA